jgi:hypothetical protein
LLFTKANQLTMSSQTPLPGVAELPEDEPSAPVGSAAAAAYVLSAPEQSPR